MIHLSNPEQPAFAPETESEVYELEFVARKVGNTALWARVKSHRKLVVDIKKKPEEITFTGEEAGLFLQDITSVKNSLPKTNCHHEPLDRMLSEYESSKLSAASALAEKAVAEQVLAA